MKILLVEDDLATQTMLADVLRACHYQVEVTSDGRSGLDLALEFAYDTIVLDIDLPGIDGISLCKMLRIEGCDTPILLLTARDEIGDRIIGLDAGADDYAIKPFNIAELSARIRALLRRGKPKVATGILTWGRLELDYDTAQIRYADRVLRLTPKEYGILELLLSNPVRIFSRSALISRLWELETTPTESVINSHIKSLRQKLKAAGASEDPIETIYGFGYRLRQSENVISSDDSEAESQAEVVDSIMLELWTQFQDSFSEQIDLLATTVKFDGDAIDPVAWDTARQVVHKLVGSLGVYGFPHGSVLASQIEDLLQRQRELTVAERQRLERLVAKLQQELTGEPVFSNAAISSTESMPVELPALVGKILAIDDDPAILHQIELILAPWGFQVIAVNDPRNFWEQLNEQTPDLLILDIEMPESSGIELCQTVRDDPQWGDLPILFITASAAPTHLRQAFAAGGDDFIRKPILEPELIARILVRLERCALVGEPDVKSATRQSRQLRQQYLRSQGWLAND
jgi:DNA-binding response OmpR family regulator